MKDETGSTGKRSLWLAYAVELPVAVALGLVFFLLLLVLLSWGIPNASGLGSLVRQQERAEGGVAVLDFAPSGQDVIAVLAQVRREVRERPPDSVVWSAAHEGESLRDRHAIQSYSASGATIRFDEATTLELGENTVVVLRRPRRDRETGRRRASVLFMNGFLSGKLGGESAGLGLEVIAGAATVHAAGDAGDTEIALALDRQTSALSVQRGTVEVAWGEATLRVPEGYMVTYDEKSPPGRLLALPQPPQPLSPAPQQSFRFRAAPPPVTFEWRPSDDCGEFRLQIAADPEFNEIVHDAEISATSFTHDNLAAGEYHWRVFAQRGAVASAPSTVGRFAVRPDAKPPGLTVDFPGGAVRGETVVLRGTADAGCRVLIGHTSIPTDATGRFEHELPLQDGYNFVVVQAIDAVGNTAFQNGTIIAEVANSGRQP